MELVVKRANASDSGHLALLLFGLLLPYFLNHPDQWAVFSEANFNPQGGMDA